MCEKEFDYEKYIWKIQFQPACISTEKYSFITIIDYVNRVLLIRRTNENTKRTKTKEIKLSDKKCYEELLHLSEISKIKEFENKSADELRKLDSGYRDGWSLCYCYYTHGDPSEIEGELSTIYKGNPIEGIIGWIYRYVPNAEVKI